MREAQPMCPTCRLGSPTRHCGKWIGTGSCPEPLGHEYPCALLEEASAATPETSTCEAALEGGVCAGCPNCEGEEL